MTASSQIHLTYREKLLHAWSSFRGPRKVVLHFKPQPAISLSDDPSGAENIINVHRAFLGDGRFWHRWLGLSELCIDKAGAISGQAHTERLCIGFFDDLDSVRASIIACLNRELIALQKKIATFVDCFELEKAKLFDDTRYVRHSRMEAFRTKHEAELTDELRELVNIYRSHPAKPITRDAISLEARYDAAVALLDNAEEERKRHNCAYIQREAITHERYFKEVEETALSEEQIVASLTYDDANVTVAAAGSGKTSVMVSKVGHAINAKLYEPDEIVVLAYNNKAATELKIRIKERLKTTKVRARTFHALGLSILLKARAEKGILKRPKVINLEGKTGQRILKQLLSDLLVGGSEPSNGTKTLPDSQFANDLLEWIATSRYPAPTVEPFPDEDVIQHEKRYEALCRKIAKGARKTKDKQWEPEIPTFDSTLYVRSFEEARIVNWMYLRDVKFEYEKIAPKFVTDRLNMEAPANQQVQFYKPDFTFSNPDGSNKSYFYEHFGLDKDGKAPAFLGGRWYEERATLKRRVMKALFEREDKASGRPRFFETRSRQFADGTFAQVLGV